LCHEVTHCFNFFGQLYDEIVQFAVPKSKMDSAAQGVAWGLLAGLVVGGFALAIILVQGVVCTSFKCKNVPGP
jgi:hypothetical protein